MQVCRYRLLDSFSDVTGLKGQYGFAEVADHHPSPLHRQKIDQWVG
jgi:hypothetical protein